MSVEILSVALDDATIDRLAERISGRIIALAGLPAGSTAPSQSVTPPAQNPHSAQGGQVSQQGSDPWADDPWAGEPATQAPPQQQQPSAPQCRHGAMRFVQAGFSQSTGKSYPAFWGCPQPRGAQDKCKSVQAR